MPARKSIEDSLRDMTEVTSTCWIWIGCRNKKGYGNLRGRMAHVVAWELANGPVPDGLQLDHTCLNKACVNVTHLEPVTNRENKLRWARTLTECPQGHPYGGDNLRLEPSGKKRCRQCMTDASRRWAKKNPDKVKRAKERYRAK